MTPYEMAVNTCKHFLGIWPGGRAKACDLGIHLDDVRADEPGMIKIPCIRVGGDCAKAEYRSVPEGTCPRCGYKKDDNP